MFVCFSSYSFFNKHSKTGAFLLLFLCSGRLLQRLQRLLQNLEISFAFESEKRILAKQMHRFFFFLKINSFWILSDTLCDLMTALLFFFKKKPWYTSLLIPHVFQTTSHWQKSLQTCRSKVFFFASPLKKVFTVERFILNVNCDPAARAL